MNRIALFVTMIFLLGASGLANAQGAACAGFVSADATYLYGSMNNRYSTATTTYSTYIAANGYANSSVSFYGRDGDGDYFSCYVPTTSALYSQAVDIKNNIRDGSYLYVYKSSTTNECASVYLLNHSCYQN